MKKALFLIVFIGLALSARAVDLEYLRKSFSKAVSDETLCKTIISKLSGNTESQVHRAYLGGFQTIWANHTYNPLTKWNTFSSGKANIEAAVKKDPKNVEIRFIRLSVQKNCPSFLGYSGNIASDKKFLKDNLNTITSEQLKKMVKAMIES